MCLVEELNQQSLDICSFLFHFNEISHCPTINWISPTFSPLITLAFSVFGSEKKRNDARLISTFDSEFKPNILCVINKREYSTPSAPPLLYDLDLAFGSTMFFFPRFVKTAHKRDMYVPTEWTTAKKKLSEPQNAKQDEEDGTWIWILNVYRWLVRMGSHSEEIHIKSIKRWTWKYAHSFVSEKWEKYI